MVIIGGRGNGGWWYGEVGAVQREGCLLPARLAESPGSFLLLPLLLLHIDLMVFDYVLSPSLGDRNKGDTESECLANQTHSPGL